MKKIRALYVELGRKYEVVLIENDIKRFNKNAKGRVGTIFLPDKTDIAINCNVNSMENIMKAYNGSEEELVVGSFLIVGYDGKNFKSLSDENIKYCRKKFGDETINKCDLNMANRKIVKKNDLER